MGDGSKFACLMAMLVALALPGGGTAAASEAKLYQATAVISGTSGARRELGFALCLKDVLVKVSGDPRLLEDARVDALAKQAGALVSGFSYRDRLSGRPIHDEQGTYDRPHDLTCDFDSGKIDAALLTLGAKPWLAPRPRIGVMLGIRDRKGATATLAEDSAGPNGADMRGSLAAAAKQLGLPVELPNRATLADAGLTIAALPTADASTLDQVAKDNSGRALAGTMAWSDSALGWVTDWRLPVAGEIHQWRISGVGFDDAFRNGMQGALQVLSGNGEPADVVR
jgi:uncharacterized protein